MRIVCETRRQEGGSAFWGRRVAMLAMLAKLALASIPVAAQRDPYWVIGAL